MSNLKTVVFTVHGIRTFGQWQQRLERLVGDDPRAASEEFKFYHRTYGYFSVLAFINPLLRWREVVRFRQHVKDVLDKEQPDRVVMVGHSFGTHIIANAIRTYSGDLIPRVELVILSGSVLQKRFPWHEIQPLRIATVVNECGTNDLVIAVNALLPLGSGLAGRHGFDGVASKSLQNRFFRFGHSGYFTARKGADDNWFMRTYWVDLLLGARDPVPVDERNSGPFQGLKTLIIDQFPNLKWTGPLTLALIFVLFLESRVVLDASLLAQLASRDALQVLSADSPQEQEAAVAILRSSVEDTFAFERRPLVRFIRSLPWSKLPDLRPPIIEWGASHAFFNTIHVQRNTVRNVDLGNTYVPEFSVSSGGDGELRITNRDTEVAVVKSRRPLRFDGAPLLSALAEVTDSSRAKIDYETRTIEVSAHTIKLQGVEENLFRLSPDGRFLITVEKLMDEGNEIDKSVRVYDVHHGTLVHHIPGDQRSHNLYAAFSEDSRYFLVLRGKDSSRGAAGQTHLQLDIYSLSNAAARYDMSTTTHPVGCDDKACIVITGRQGDSRAAAEITYVGEPYFGPTDVTIESTSMPETGRYRHAEALFFDTIYDPESDTEALLVVESDGTVWRYVIDKGLAQPQSFRPDGVETVAAVVYSVGKLFLFVDEDTETGQSGLVVLDPVSLSVDYAISNKEYCPRLYQGLGRSKGNVVRDREGTPWIWICDGTNAFLNLREKNLGDPFAAAINAGNDEILALVQPLAEHFDEGNKTVRTDANGRIAGFARLGFGDGAYVPDSSVAVVDMARPDEVWNIGLVDQVMDFHFNADGTVLVVDTGDYEGSSVVVFDVASGKRIAEVAGEAKIDTEGHIWLTSTAAPYLGAVKVPDSLSEKLNGPAASGDGSMELLP